MCCNSYYLEFTSDHLRFQNSAFQKKCKINSKIPPTYQIWLSCSAPSQPFEHLNPKQPLQCPDDDKPGGSVHLEEYFLCSLFNSTWAPTAAAVHWSVHVCDKSWLENVKTSIVIPLKNQICACIVGIRQKSKYGRKATYFLMDTTKNYFPTFKVQAVLQIKYIIL